MSTVQYQCSMSLDGFIAGPGGDMSWLGELVLESDPATAAIVHQVGALLIGNNTFRGDDPNKGTESEGAYGGQWTGPSIVLTHNIPDTPVPDVTFVSDLETAVAMAKEAAGDKVVSVLGANVAKQLIEAGLLDEILVWITPVLLGDGVRLFDHPGGTNIKLEVLDMTGPNMLMRVVK
ncbi:dihydrofolate reductase family protein [Saccharopolyspora sp. ASAGF58]|uniref:dihydrofolate reductase family protein n=1 Tax=Saccharopolyspora sp. ASAGF58 TaxID=2719023 RepID=UPI00143FC8E5|nr:dihydrofolate reductase family protein [Saccharopolyspora sp. ASAGF58]QIZ39035.1 dihydrofolate reductase [Saccharopolyspora sp. ASAGF58]